MRTATTRIPIIVDYMYYYENKKKTRKLLIDIIFPYRELNPSLLGESQVS